MLAAQAGRLEAPFTGGFGRIGEDLKEKAITLEELIESGRETRGQMVEKEYGLKAGDEGRSGLS